MVYLDMKVEFCWNFKKNREKRERERETRNAPAQNLAKKRV